MQGFSDQTFDLLVIGGGINGAGIARDAAGRGLKVMLAEAGDLAAATSSASSKLIHGGLRYLEHFNFRLVRESLAEREVILRNAPHLVRPMTFVLPHNNRLRPRWMLRLGLFLYDHLGGRRSLHASQPVNLARGPYRGMLRAHLARGFIYSDCWADDAGLVIANARDARARGAAILTRSRVLEARPAGGGWRATIRGSDGNAFDVAARVIVNAAGPWAEQVDRAVLGIDTGARLRLVKGSHIVVPQLYKGDHAFLLQAADQRVVFVLPFQDRFSLIGTTEVDVQSADDPRITPAEVDYLCRTVGDYFRNPPGPADIVWSFAGVRPLVDDQKSSASAVTRDYVLQLHDRSGVAALSIYGGKLTTYRRLAESALGKLSRLLPAMTGNWTADAPLPERQLHHEGHEIVPGLTAGDIDYLTREEFARTAEDILWRRTKIGLDLEPSAAASVAQWLEHAKERLP